MNFLYQQKKSKYNNRKTVVDSITFDSRKEAMRFQELKILEKQGIIQNLELQKRFVIVPKINGIKGSRARHYVADFVYMEVSRTGEILKRVIEDVKSPITRKNPVYTLKKQLVQWQYPQYEFREY